MARVLSKIGVWASPRILKAERKEVNTIDPVYGWVPFQAYSGKHILEGDWISSDLQAFLSLPNLWITIQKLNALNFCGKF